MISGKVFYGGANAVVNKENTIVKEGDTMVVDNTDTLTMTCECGENLKCECEPEVSQCDCHANVYYQDILNGELDYAYAQK